jgi:CubicO group peptidase (beta-lactamase class C family)
VNRTLPHAELSYSSVGLTTVSPQGDCRMRFLSIAGAIIIGLAATSLFAPAPAAEPRTVASLDALLQPYLDRYGLPALAAAVARDGQIVAAGAVGTRRAGARIPVTINDRFHIGSDTKAMTALLAAIQVERGGLAWTSTIGQVFPELAAAAAPDVAGVTLTQLLSHTGGIAADNEAIERLLIASFAEETLNLDELRYAIVKQAVAQPLAAKPGTRFLYSNMGYLLAGTMLERVGKSTWEEMIVAQLFEPLALKSAGFGPQSRLGRVDAPLGHLGGDGAPPKPMLAGPGGDNPVVLGPAGTAHMSVLDFARWGAWNAGMGKRGPALVRADTLWKLHAPVIDMPPRPDAAPGTPAVGSYGLGWGTISVPFAGEPILFHGGSNTKNLAQIFVQPSRDLAIVLMTNIGSRQADDGFKVLAQALFEKFGGAR